MSTESNDITPVPSTPNGEQTVRANEQSHSFTVAHESLQLRTGPIPDPETLVAYDQIIPNGADRIMKMAEEQAAHRREMEKLVISGNVNVQNKGNNQAFILSVIFCGTGLTFAWLGHAVEGAAIISSNVIGLAYVFVTGKRSQAEERKEKAQRQLPPKSSKKEPSQIEK